MIKIHIQYFGQLLHLVPYSERELELLDSVTVLDFIRQLGAEHSVLAPHLLTAEHYIRPSLLLIINNQVVPADKYNQRLLTDGDRLLLMPPIAGG